jgi:tetratricopeptide (TPR) repeat protein
MVDQRATHAGGQQALLGQGPKALVAELLSAYDHARTSGTPVWVSLEGSSGWGKTRLVQELYRTMAARQTAPRYWPASIQASVAAGVGDEMERLEARRKHIAPRFVAPDDGAVPEWFWWGISCSRRSGSEAQALAQDLTQFAAHAPGLEARWKAVVGVTGRVGRHWSRRKGDVIETGLGEAASAAAGLANVAVPGLGFILMGASWAIKGAMARATEGTELLDASGAGRADLVAQLAPELLRLAAAGIPMVIAIEDVHDADESLVEVLATVLRGTAPVLVVTTSWPGLLEDPVRPCARLAADVDDGRVLRVDLTQRDVEIPEQERLLLLAGLETELPAPIAAALAARYRNPLALQLAAVLVAQDLEDGRTVTADAVARMPTAVRDLGRESWRRLPRSVQRVLAVAALLRPSTVSDLTALRDPSWDHRTLLAVVDAVPFLRRSVADLRDDLDHATTAYGWVRTVDEWLRTYHDEIQTEIAAAEAATDLFDDRTDIYEAVAAWLARDGHVPDATSSRLLIALACEGFIPWIDAARRALEDAAEAASEGGANNDQRALVGPLVAALDAVADDDELRARLGATLGQIGRHAEAVQQLERVVQNGDLAADSGGSTALWARHELVVCLAQAGRTEDALAEARTLAELERRAFGPDGRSTLATRLNLALISSRLQGPESAVDDVRSVLIDQSRAFGDDDPAVLRTRGILAGLLFESLRYAEALALLDGLVDDQTRILGADHIDTFESRAVIARIALRAGVPDLAVLKFSEVLPDCAIALGPLHPLTLRTAGELVMSLAATGDLTRAVKLGVGLVEERRIAFGCQHPETLAAERMVAGFLVQAGQSQRALDLLWPLLERTSELLGEGHPATLDGRRILAQALGEAGDPEAAVDQLVIVVDLWAARSGLADRSALGARIDLATWRGRAGAMERAAADLLALVPDASDALGARHPLTLTVRANAAGFLGGAGGIAEALDQFDQVIDELEHGVGPDHPATLAAQAGRAQLRGSEGGGDLLR